MRILRPAAPGPFRRTWSQLAQTRGEEGAGVLPRQRRSRLEIPLLAGTVRGAAWLSALPRESGRVPARLRQHPAGWPGVARVRGQRWLGQGGPTYHPFPPPQTGAPPAPGTPSCSAGTAASSSSWAGRATLRADPGLDPSAAKGPRTGSVRRANPCQGGWLVRPRVAPRALRATRTWPHPRALQEGSGPGTVPPLIHFGAPQPGAARWLSGASSLVPTRGGFL